MERFHYTYRIDFPECRKVYFGVRSSKCLPEDDVKYLGSPVSHKEYWAKYKLVKTILNIYPTREDAESAEEFLILQQWKENKEVSLNAGAGRVSWNSLGLPRHPNNRAALIKANTGRESPQKTKDAVAAAKARPYYLISSQGYISKGYNVREFCRVNELDYTTCSRVLRGEKFHHHGWTSSWDAHKLYMESYANRGLTYRSYDKYWIVCNKKTNHTYFKTKESAIAYRDELASQGLTWQVYTKNWKQRLAAMQAKAA